MILFVAMFIVGGALFETGMANKIGGIVTRFAKTERMLIVAIMVIVGLMSGVLSNTGTAAVLIPVVIGIAAKSGYKRSKLLMPILIAGILFYATIGYKLLPECDPKEEEAFDTKRDFDQVPKWKQWMSLIILILTLLAMIFEEKIGISLCVSGGIGALLLILTGVISEKMH